MSGEEYLGEILVRIREIQRIMGPAGSTGAQARPMPRIDVSD